jgi:hypothetical protein
MWESIQDYEPVIRLSAFLGIFTAVALWEFVAPRRARAIPRLVRWPNNIGIVVFNTGVMRVLFPTAAVGMALAAVIVMVGIRTLRFLPDSLSDAPAKSAEVTP